MKKLSKDEEKRRSELSEELKKIAAEVDEAVVAANNAIDKVNDIIERYNNVVGEANGFREDIVNAIESYMDERSEKWHESDRASSYEDWKQEWEDELSELSTYSELDSPSDLDHEKLDSYPSEVG